MNPNEQWPSNNPEKINRQMGVTEHMLSDNAIAPSGLEDLPIEELQRRFDDALLPENENYELAAHIKKILEERE